jgi:hypothetical protein
MLQKKIRRDTKKKRKKVERFLLMNINYSIDMVNNKMKALLN